MLYRAAVACLAVWLAGAQETDVFEQSQRLLEAGDYHRARTGFATALRQMESQYGEFDARTLDARIFYGQVLTMIGRPNLALNVLGPLMRYYDAPGRRLSKQGQIARGSFALALRESGEAGRAVELLERVVKTFPEETAVDRIHIARFHSELAASYAYLGKYVEAEANSRAALSRLEAAGSPPLAHRVSVLTILGQIYLLSHRYSDAEAALERARQAAPAHWQPHHPEMGIVHAGLGMLAIRNGRLAEAERLTRSALVSMEYMLGPDHIETGAVAQQLAEVLRKLKRKEEAREFSERAKRIRAKAAPPATVSVWGFRDGK